MPLFMLVIQNFVVSLQRKTIKQYELWKNT